MVSRDVLELLREDYPLSSRIINLKNNFFETIPSICVQRARYYTQSFCQTEALPLPKRRALAVKNVLENMDLYIADGELILGALAEKSRGSSVFPEIATRWIIDEFNGNPYNFDERPGDIFVYSEDIKRELLEDVFPYWAGKAQEDKIIAKMPKHAWTANMDVGGTNGSWILNSGDGHIIPDFVKIINKGLVAIICEIDERISQLDIADPQYPDSLAYLEAMKISNEAVIAYAERFVALAADLAAKETNETRKQELLNIRRIAQQVPAYPARSFEEALQSIMFLNIAFQIENNGLAYSFGRFDQYLYPFYQRDVLAGNLSPQYAHELLNCFWMKINEMSKFRDWPATETFVGYLVYQNLTIGGQTIHGKDAINDLSYICLASTKNIRMIQPSLTVRCFNGMDERFLLECAKTVALGIGMPSLFNDEIIIPSLLNIGYSLDDAMDYALIGCVEPDSPGKGGGRHGACFTNLAKCLELALHGGTDPRTGIRLQEGKQLEEINSYAEFLEEYKKQLTFFLREHVVWDNTVDSVWEDMLPNPLLCSHVQDCISRAKDIKSGGAHYDFTGGVVVGVASAVNCLAALKKLVFEEKALTPKQLLHALSTNFADKTNKPTGEEIRQMLLHAPKFGNDDEETAAIAEDLIDFWSSSKMSFKNTRFGRGPIGGHFIPSSATVASNVSSGKIVGATPDGRKAFDQLSEGVSAFSGTDTEGPTALIHSVAGIPNIRMPGGQLMNIKLNPSSIRDENGKRNIVTLIKSYFELKGMQMQFNVIDRKTLIAAQKEPEKYRDIIVRVAGYSAFFTTLAPDVQNAVIARTEHDL